MSVNLPFDPGVGPRRHVAVGPSLDLPEEAFAVALLHLPGLSAGVLAAILGHRRGGLGRSPSEAWRVVASGRAGELWHVWREKDDPVTTARRWSAAAARFDIGRMWARYADVRVDVFGTAGYPLELADDPRAPQVLFRTGAATDLDGRRAAIVGTRRATDAGLAIAAELGGALAAAGVRVISGLALGIDGAAHRGALAAGAASPIAVVAGGFDCPYPARHRVLWGQVAARGCLVSESPLGVRSEGWRFPARNRIIAGLAEAVIVVESRATGGSMVTADLALERGVTVMAVPGSIRSESSAGTNGLIRDGAIPVCEVGDVFLALGLTGSPAARPDTRLPPPAGAARVRDAVGFEPTATDRVVAACGLPPATVLAHLATLETSGWVRGGSGWWQRL